MRNFGIHHGGSHYTGPKPPVMSEQAKGLEENSNIEHGILDREFFIDCYQNHGGRIKTEKTYLQNAQISSFYLFGRWKENPGRFSPKSLYLFSKEDGQL